MRVCYLVLLDGVVSAVKHMRAGVVLQKVCNNAHKSDPNNEQTKHKGANQYAHNCMNTL